MAARTLRRRQQAFDLLDSGQADAFVEDDTVLHGMRARLRSSQAWRITGPYLSVEPFAIMFSAARTDRKELRTAIDRSLRRLMGTGELAALHQRWFEQAIPPHGEALGIGMGPLMRDFIRHPTTAIVAQPQMPALQPELVQQGPVGAHGQGRIREILPDSRRALDGGSFLLVLVFVDRIGLLAPASLVRVLDALALVICSALHLRVPERRRATRQQTGADNRADNKNGQD